MTKRKRSRSRGSLQKYATKTGTRWRFQIWIPADPENPEAGQKKFGQAGFTSAKAADAAMQTALAKRDQNLRFAEQIPSLETYTKQWLASLRLADSTIQGYKNLTKNHLLPYLGKNRLDKISPTQIARHYAFLEREGNKNHTRLGESLSVNTVHKVHVVLAAILESAIDEAYISSNPAKAKTVRPPTPKEINAAKPEQETWTSEQLKTVLAWLKNEQQDELYLLWHVLAYTGLRRGEAMGLKWGDINFSRNTLSIRRAVNPVDYTKTKSTKTGNSRVISLDQTTLEEFKTHKLVREQFSRDFIKHDALIFANENGLPRSPDSITCRWSRRLDWLTTKYPDLPRVSLKGLRHTHATILLELGLQPKVAQERLGHSNITTTMNIYSHVMPNIQEQAAMSFEKALKPDAET